MACHTVRMASSRLSGPALAALLPELDGPGAAPGPLYAALATAIARLVVDGRVAVATRLPSERDLAAALGRSRATVTGAYDQLRADGFVDSRTGAGSFVTVPAGSRPRTQLGWQTAPRPDDTIDLSMAMFPAAPPQVRTAALAAAGDELGTQLHDVGYDPAGLPELRAAVAARFTRRGVPTDPDQILVTGGALHALDLVLRLLVAPGDRVVTEIPNYPGAIAAIDNGGGRVTPAPITADGGWHTEQLESLLRHVSPRLAYLTPDFHNPSGGLVGAAERRTVLAAARRAGTTVVVDETFVELGFCPPAPPMAALDPAVVTLGSLSKAVWGGLRIGWIRAGADLIGRLAALRTVTDIGGPILEQLIAVRLLDQLDDITALRVTELRAQCDALRAALTDQLPGWRTRAPQGGLSLWVELDAPLSTPLTALAERAGVILVPGARFGVDGTFERFLRLPYTWPAERLTEAVSRIAAVWRELGAAPSGRASRLVVA